MAMIEPSPPAKAAARPSFGELLRLAIQHAGPALGLRSMILAAAALALGLVCVVLSIFVMTSLLKSAEAGDRGRLTREVIGLDASYRAVMRDIVVAGNPAMEELASPVEEDWTRFRTWFVSLCQRIDQPRPPFEKIAEICAQRDALLPRLTGEIEKMSRTRQPVSASTMRELVNVRDVVSGLGLEVARQSDGLVTRLAEGNRRALLVLIGSTGWFICAGIVLVFLLGRVSLLNFAQSRKASEAAELLRETLDVLPAGVVVYDRDERLLMFNEVAASNSPALRDGNPIGRTYEDMARENARRLEATGQRPQPVEMWLERFRNKRTREVRAGLDGRLFEWSERATPSGRTVGLRVDVTELEKARSEYAQLVDSLSDIVYKVDAGNGKIVFANRAAAQFLGLPLDQVVGSSFIDRVDPDVRDGLAAGMRHPFRNTGRSIQVRFRMQAGDGTLRHVETRFGRRMENGRLIVSGVLRDIDDTVRMERQIAEQVTLLERARREYQTLVDSLNDVVFKLDLRSGKFVFASAQAAELLGVLVEQLPDRRFLDFVAPEDHAKLLRISRQAVRSKGGLAEETRFRMIGADGFPHHVESRVRKMVDEHGNALLVGVLHDVEQRVQLEQRLEEERARLRSVVESSGAMMVLLDADLGITMVNSGFTAITGIEEADAIGHPLAEVMDCPLNPSVIDTWRRCALYRQRIEPLQFAVKLDGPQGRQRLVAITATPVGDAGGRMASIVLLGVDETARREAEAVLHDVERFSTVGEMAAMMAHEISQPLQVINLASTSAREELVRPADEEDGPDMTFVQMRLERIGQQVEKASRVVGDFRAFVRGANRPESAGQFDPGDCIRSAAELTAYGLRQAGIEFSVKRAPVLPSLSGEPGRLEQVLVNLINNARDAGGKAITISADTVDEDGRRCLHLVVEDTGPGIPEDVLPRLFVSFVTTKAGGKGTGLGLRICRRIVEEMGGNISAANVPGCGARFEILLPAATKSG